MSEASRLLYQSAVGDELLAVFRIISKSTLELIKLIGGNGLVLNTSKPKWLYRWGEMLNG